jgi:transcriptional regulator with XRE-family HTH domain
MTNIGKKIELLRIKHGFKSQRQLALKSNISSATLSRIESGLQNPNPETLMALSECLPSTTYQELMHLAGYPTNGESQDEIIIWKERAIKAEMELIRLNGLIDLLIKERDNK